MPEDAFSKPRFCSQCGQPIVVVAARFCKECGAPLEATGFIRRDIGMRPLIAFGLSLVPGLGHLYQGHPFRGCLWFFGVAFAYQAGPIVTGEFHLPGTTSNLEYRVGVVLGINSDAPRQTWLARLEYEFF